MTKHSTVTVLDIGTDKIVTLVGQLEENSSQIRVLGVSSVRSRGIRKSQIVDIEDAIEATEKVGNTLKGIAIRNS